MSTAEPFSKGQWYLSKAKHERAFLFLLGVQAYILLTHTHRHAFLVNIAASNEKTFRDVSCHTQLHGQPQYSVEWWVWQTEWWGWGTKVHIKGRVPGFRYNVPHKLIQLYVTINPQRLTSTNNLHDDAGVIGASTPPPPTLNKQS